MFDFDSAHATGDVGRDKHEVPRRRVIFETDAASGKGGLG
jgi:hypothetical protein